MAQLIVRNLEESVKRRLQRRAKANGRSMEEETRVILRETVGNEANGSKSRKGSIKGKGFGSRFASHFTDLDEPVTVREWNEPVKPSKFRR
jgi:antitoxin FitA